MDGQCPNCMAAGKVGEKCGETGCAARRYHFVPAEYIDEEVQGLARDPYVGIRVQDFLLVRRQGQGGFGSVYLALQLPVLMKTAVKLLRAIGEKSDDLATGRQTFESEARAMARLHHPNIVRLNRYGLVGETPYLAMEYVHNGRELKDLLKTRREAGFSFTEIHHLISQLLRALSAAHEENIIHRDIKPGNMMIQEVKGDPLFLRVLDFGLVKFFSESPETTLARGTPLYMAPEQLQGRNIGPWTDVYAAGLILYELITGRKPFVFQPQDLLFSYKLDPNYSVLNEPEAEQIPAPVRDIIGRSTQVDVDKRFPSADAFHEALDEAFGISSATINTAPSVLTDEVTVSAADVGEHTPGDPIPSSDPKTTVPSATDAPTTLSTRLIARFRGRRRLRVLLAGILLVATLFGTGVFFWTRMDDGAEIRVSDATIGDQLEVALVQLSSGTLAAAWDSDHPEADRKDVYLRTLAADGSPLGEPIRVNTHLEADQEMPVLAALPGDGLVVAWTSSGQDGDHYGLSGQLFDDSLGRVSDEFPINQTWTRGEQSEPTIVVAPEGGFTIVWQSTSGDGDGFGIVGQRFSPAAERIGPEWVLNETTEGLQQYPDAAALPGGSFVVTWESDQIPGDDNYGILLRIFGADGTPATSEVQVNTTTAERQRWPKAVSLGDEGFVVTWSSENQDGDMFGAYIRFFDVQGTPTSGEVRVNDLATGNQYLAQLAPLNDGSIAAAWCSDGKDGSGLGVVGSVFDRSGRRLRPETVLNHFTSSDQVIRSVLPLDDGTYLAAWDSRNQDGDGWGVYVRRIDVESAD